MSLKLYIAGSSAEIERARAWHELARAEGFEVLSTWVEVITQVGEGNPRDATVDARSGWSAEDLRQVANADVVWFLVPPKGKETRGAWLEIGFALAQQIPLFCSGDTKQSIFCALGREFENDREAWEAIKS